MKKLKLLYAEDDKTIREGHLAYIKSRFDFEVHEAEDGVQALELYNKHQHEIVLTDIEMPNMSGLHFANEIRKISKFTKIIIISAHSEPANLMDALDLYLVNFIVKPISKQKLSQSIQTAIDTLVVTQDKEDHFLIIEANAKFDISTHNYFVNDTKVKLSKSEGKLLEHLATNRTNSISSMDIFMAVWDDFEKEYSQDAVRTLVKKLRKKLPPKSIENIYGGYYKLNI